MVLNFLVPFLVSGLVGWQWGALAGGIAYAASSFLWNTIFPPSAADLNLDDQFRGKSSEGVFLPKIYGSCRLPGLVVHAGKTEQKQGHDEIIIWGFWAVAFCEGEVKKVQKVWINDELFYDTSSTATDRTRERGQHWEDNGKLKHYLGTETQTPDSVIVTELGAGNVPAMRGVVYTRFGKKFPLDEFSATNPGNANVNAEIIGSGDTIFNQWQQINEGSEPYAARTNHSLVSFNNKLWLLMGFDSSAELQDVWSTSDGVNWTQQPNFGGIRRSSFCAASLNGNLIVLGGYSDDAGGGRVSDHVWSSQNGQAWSAVTTSGDTPFDTDGLDSAACCVYDGTLYISGGDEGVPGRLSRKIWSTTNGASYTKISNDDDKIIFDRKYHSQVVFNDKIYIIGGTALSIAGDGGVDHSNACIEFNPSTLGISELVSNLTDNGITAAKGNGEVFGAQTWTDSAGTEKLIALVTGSGRTETHSSTDGATWYPWAAIKEEHTITGVSAGDDEFEVSGDITDQLSNGDTFFVYNSTGNDGRWTVSSISYDSGTTTTTIGTSENITDATVDGSLVVPVELGEFDITADYYPAIGTLNQAIYVIGGDDGSGFSAEEYKLQPAGVNPTQVTIQSIIEDIGTDEGYTPSTDFEFVNFDDDVDKLIGYPIFTHSSGRDRIEPLRKYAFFDIVNDGEKIKFVKRGGSSVVTITQDELGVVEVNGVIPDQFPDYANIEREKDTNLPKVIKVNYFDYNRDYKQGTQQSKRIYSGSKKEEVVSIPVVMSAAKATQIANVLLFDAWQQRNLVIFTVPPKYMYLIPTDVVTIQTGTETLVVRIVEMTLTASRRIEVRAAIEDLNIYTTSFEGVQGTGENLVRYSEDEASGSAQNLDGVFLNIPKLEKSDPELCFYYGAKRPDGDDTLVFQGAELHLSKDGGTEFRFLQSIYQEVTYGQCLNYIPDYTGDLSSFDTYQDITVELEHGELLASSDDQVTNDRRVNLAAIQNGSDWELVQFVNCTDNGDGTYTIGRFLRGKYGTKSFIAGHADLDVFVLLDNVVAIPLDEGDIDTEYIYKTVPKFLETTDVDLQSFTFTGISAKPYAPSNITGSFVADPSGLWVIEWDHNARVEGEQEESEGIFKFEFYLDATLKETYERSFGPAPWLNKINYTRDMQINDYGAVMSGSIKIILYQVSPITAVGDGYSTTKVLTA